MNEQFSVKTISIGDLFKCLCKLRSGYHTNNFVRETGVLIAITGDISEINELKRLIDGVYNETDSN